jgi:L-asparaginase
MAIKDPDGRVPDTAIRNVAIAKDGSYRDDDYAVEPEAEVDLIATIGYRLKSAPLAGFVLERFTYGRSPQAHDTGFCSEPYTAGFQSFASDAATPRNPSFIAGSNLTATKARLPLMACLMKFRAVPPAANPDQPTAAETAAVCNKVAGYQSRLLFVARSPSIRTGCCL